MMGKPPREVDFNTDLALYSRISVLEKKEYIVLSSKSPDGHQGTAVQDKL